jgi:hypothetical protein
MHMLIMIKRLFFTLCLMTMAAVSVHAEVPPTIKVSLGIRDTNSLRITNVTYPLAFRIENTGKTAIKGRDIADIFTQGVIYLLAADGMGQQYELKKQSMELHYGIVPNDVPPGKTYDCKLVGDIITFFPSAKDGDYQVWWTWWDSKSNVLRFTVTNGKVSIK